MNVNEILGYFTFNKKLAVIISELEQISPSTLKDLDATGRATSEAERQLIISTKLKNIMDDGNDKKNSK